ncbi:D-alanine--D-alanine ligase [Bacillus cereus Rock4-18]|nr:D-alanine--D-alanine ligase [Bacillus cereus Rock4-18]
MKVVESITELTNVWYHGTTSLEVPSIKSRINLDACNELVDFGKGFYLTSNPSQAWKWASRKATIQNTQRNFLLKRAAKMPIKPHIPNIASPAVIQFEIDLELLSKLDGKVFKEDDQWAYFILGNRFEGETIFSPLHNKDSKFHYAYGPLADGTKIGFLAEEAERERNISRFLEEIKGKRYRFPIENQLSVHTNTAVDCLNFKGVFNSEPTGSITQR